MWVFCAITSIETPTKPIFCHELLAIWQRGFLARFQVWREEEAEGQSDADVSNTDAIDSPGL